MYVTHVPFPKTFYPNKRVAATRSPHDSYRNSRPRSQAPGPRSSYHWLSPRDRFFAEQRLRYLLSKAVRTKKEQKAFEAWFARLDPHEQLDVLALA